jgi:hypothetical protein
MVGKIILRDLAMDTCTRARACACMLVEKLFCSMKDAFVNLRKVESVGCGNGWTWGNMCMEERRCESERCVRC